MAGNCGDNYGICHWPVTSSASPQRIIDFRAKKSPFTSRCRLTSRTESAASCRKNLLNEFWSLPDHALSLRTLFDHKFSRIISIFLISHLFFRHPLSLISHMSLLAELYQSNMEGCTLYVYLSLPRQHLRHPNDYAHHNCQETSVFVAHVGLRGMLDPLGPDREHTPGTLSGTVAVG